MSEVYVVMVEDRHRDTEAFLFSTAEDSIAFAKRTAEELRSKVAVDPEDAAMSAEQLAEAGWLYYECYSPEGDCVWVLPRVIDEELQ